VSSRTAGTKPSVNVARGQEQGTEGKEKRGACSIRSGPNSHRFQGRWVLRRLKRSSAKIHQASIAGGDCAWVGICPPEKVGESESARVISNGQTPVLRAFQPVEPWGGWERGLKTSPGGVRGSPLGRNGVLGCAAGREEYETQQLVGEEYIDAMGVPGRRGKIKQDKSARAP